MSKVFFNTSQIIMFTVTNFVVQEKMCEHSPSCAQIILGLQSQYNGWYLANNVDPTPRIFSSLFWPSFCMNIIDYLWCFNLGMYKDKYVSKT